MPDARLAVVKRKLILRNHLSPGDLVMLTAAVRDLHHCFPGRFLTDVRSSCPELWEHNPHLTPLHETDRGVEQIDCHYPLIDRSNEAPYHCIHGFAHFLSTRLRLDIRPTLFRGDIHLSAEERRWKSVVHELGGRDLPFWIINAGGKFDYTIKWWDGRRYQSVVDHFQGRVLFVQVGEIGHHHPPLKNVVDLRGKTDLRQLVRLVYHSQGVLCGVTALMHLAAAVPARPERPPSRAAVIVAGGREPTHWEAYPQHQFIHTLGALSCCATGGCWRARTRAVGDGEEADAPHNLCTNVTRDLPRCMDMITPAEVIRRIETYFDGGSISYLNPRERTAAPRAITRSRQGPGFDSTINLAGAPAALEQAATEARHAPLPQGSGRGLLLFASQADELLPLLACARLIRSLGDTLPIECWITPRCPRPLTKALSELGARVRRARSTTGQKELPVTRAELRLIAVTQTKFREVAVIEPGTFPLVAPESWFRKKTFRSSGVLFPAGPVFRARPGVWKLTGLGPPIHTADASVMLVDRWRCWSALHLWRWMVDRTYFFHGYVDGDGGAAQLAFARLALPAPLSTHFRSSLWPGRQPGPMPGPVKKALRWARQALRS